MGLNLHVVTVGASVMLIAAAVSNAAVLSTSYVSGTTPNQANVGQVADDALFTKNVHTIDLSGPSPSVTLQVGQFFRFGVQASVSGIPNPEAGSSWDMANQSVNGGPPQPAQLGIHTIGFKFQNSDAAGAILAPLTSTTGAFPRSTASINGAIGFDASDKGNVNGGDVGDTFQLGGGFTTENPEIASGVAKLSALTSAANVFTNLKFTATSEGTATVTPVIDTAALGFWSREAPGTVDAGGNPLSDPVYVNRPFTVGTDTISSSLTPITFTVIPAPEPSSALLFSTAVVAGLLRRRRQTLSL